MSIFNSSIIAREQYIPRVARAQHTSYLQHFWRHDKLHTFVCKLGHELYSCTVYMYVANVRKMVFDDTYVYTFCLMFSRTTEQVSGTYVHR